MVNLQQQVNPKLITGSQEKLIYQLLQSKWILKHEFEEFHKLRHSEILTSYDASKVITKLLADINYRKNFYSKKRRAKASCAYCGSKDNLKRYAELPDLHQVWTCEECDSDLVSVEHGNTRNIETK